MAPVNQEEERVMVASRAEASSLSGAFTWIFNRLGFTVSMRSGLWKEVPPTFT
ncbi:MAG: hypothetical protein LUE93_03445 [Bacteroides sp.]|nr:hypothetical protein [Bacteroides sp.]